MIKRHQPIREINLINLGFEVEEHVFPKSYARYYGATKFTAVQHEDDYWMVVVFGEVGRDQIKITNLELMIELNAVLNRIQDGNQK